MYNSSYVMSSPQLNVLDKAALGAALFRYDTDPLEDKWAIYVGKFGIALALAFHIVGLYKITLRLPMPPEGLRWVISLAIIALCYVPVHLATHPVEKIQQVRLSRRERWRYRALALLFSPLSALIYPIAYLTWVFVFGGTPN